jgi:benzoyl-CoA reductase subunit D
MPEPSREHLTAGIDAGSSSVKVALLRSRAGERGELLGHGLQRIRRRNLVEVVRAAFAAACAGAGLTLRDFDYVASTGDGDAVDFRTGHFYSMTTHARGALFFEPEARAALDVGALHARAMSFDHRGKVLRHRMTSQCASGTGQFLENIARYLGVAIEDVGQLSLGSTAAEPCSSICAVLAETDVINLVSRGVPTADILRGIHLSVAGRLVRLLRASSEGGVVLVTGGLARDAGLLACVREMTPESAAAKERAFDVRAHPDSILAGAVGAALLGAYRHAQLERAGSQQVRPPAWPYDEARAG